MKLHHFMNIKTAEIYTLKKRMLCICMCIILKKKKFNHCASSTKEELDTTSSESPMNFVPLYGIYH